jgi:DNA (cytosine-5)-methyltransferase 1
MKELTHIDLFSGIGGFALAARWAGIKTVQFVEIDPFCQKVLQKNFKGVPIHDDIKTFTNAQSDRRGSSAQPKVGEQEGGRKRGCGFVDSDYDSHFLLTGGFPCQPFSCAGKRRGKEDDRYLWEEMLRVIKEFKPTWIIGENVNGIRSMEFQGGVSELEGDTIIQEDGNGDYTNVLDGICDSLEAIGYEVQPVIIPACAVNAPHRRDRVWIVAHSNRTGCGASTSETDGIRAEVSEKQQLPQPEYSRQDCHAPDTSNQGLQRGEETGNTSINGEESRNELIGRCPGWEEPWLEVATRLCRVDDGVSRGVDRTNRLKSLGNSVVPMIPFLLMKAILEAENVKP